MNIRVIHHPISPGELQKIASEGLGDMVKGVVDIEKKIIALGGDLHADEERVLLEQGSIQENLWGFNVYPDQPKDQWVEYRSLINIRPRQGNRSMDVQNSELRKKIFDIVNSLII